MTSRQALPRDDTMKTAIQILAFCLALMSPGPGRADAVDPSVDTLAFDLAEDLAEIPFGSNFTVRVSVDSDSAAKLKFTGLPAGISYDAKSGAVTGCATKPGVYTVNVDGSNANGYTFSQVFKSTVTNQRGLRISGSDCETEIGEYFSAEFDDLFDCDEDTRTVVSLNGLPSGLLWDASWGLVYGTPKKSGDFVIKATVRFKDGKRETATLLLTVRERDPDDYGVDLTCLEGLALGDSIESQDGEIGGASIVSVSGLPPGMSSETWKDEDGEKCWGVHGMATSPGLFTVSVTVSEKVDGTTVRTVTKREILVEDVPCAYFDVGLYDPSNAVGGKVTGGGPVKPGTAVTLTAKPSSGYVFAGWYDEELEPFEFEGGTDYRKPKIAFPAGTDYALLSLRARFEKKAQDGSVDLDDLADAEFDLDPELGMEEEFAVHSLSLPTLTFKNMPKGVKCVSGENGCFVLSYDPETVKTRPAPGRYKVKATAVNQSKAKATETFTITVSNLADPRINVEDDYGEYDPCVEIDPIDLSDAVDFAHGETLSVSGLPKGLKFNKKADSKKGIGANTITGTPTAPGDYVLKFTARVVSSVTTNAKGKVTTKYATAKATSFFTVLPYPELSVWTDDESLSAGNKVSGGGSYKPGSKVTLKATAAKGWVFAGWSGLDDATDLEALKPSLSYVTGDAPNDIYANFIRVEDDGLFIAPADEIFETGTIVFRLGEAVSGEMSEVILALIDTMSLPTVKVTGLPKGFKFDTKKLLLSGKPSKSGVFYVTVTAKNAGGYSFVRVLRFVVTDADGNLPGEPEPKNAAGIDFTEVRTGFVTGVLDERGFVVDASEAHGAVTKVTLSGVPAGLKGKTVLSPETGSASVMLGGTPAKPGRFTLKAKAKYADRKTAESVAYLLVEDGGSAYLSVWSADGSIGAVKGTGVYASGQTVKIVAQAKSKNVFAGWYDGAAAATGVWQVVSHLTDVDGLDVRQASVSFPFRPRQFDVRSFCARFAAKSEDAQIAIDLEDEVWVLDRTQDCEFRFSVESVSYPKVTVKGLPKGVSMDAARGLLRYDAGSSKKPATGETRLTLTAKNQSGKSVSAKVTVCVTDSDE